MAKPILVANWKNYPKSLHEAKTLLAHLTRNSRVYKKINLFIAAPFTYFDLVSVRGNSFSKLASQDITSFLGGTSTGEITPDILKSFGIRLSIIGHSERRALGESDDVVSRKIRVALATSIIPLVCVGEVRRDQDGEYFEVLRQQLKLSLKFITKKSEVSKLMIAYEPVWAIGKTSKDAISPEDLSQAIIFIKKILADIFGRSAAERIPILYGGSVEPTDAPALYQGTGVRGFLVGHASLSAEHFKVIAESLT